MLLSRYSERLHFFCPPYSMLNAEWLDAAAAVAADFTPPVLVDFAAAVLAAFAAAPLADFGPWLLRADFVALALPALVFGRWALVFEPWPLADLDLSVQVFAPLRLRRA